MLIASLLLATGPLACQPSPGTSVARYGMSLPHTEAEFDELGQAVTVLDADDAPLRRLDLLLGDWIIEGDYHPWPGSPLTTVSPVCQCRWILGGRCLELRYQYHFEGETIMDLVLVRWNPLESVYDMQMYSSGWPFPNGGSGRWDEDTGILEFVMTTTNPATRKPVTTLYRLEDLKVDAHRWIQYRTGDNGELVAFFTMNATRLMENQP